MAAAFAALISLKNGLDLIQNHPTHSFSFEPKQIQSLEETVRSLINLMKSHARSPGIRKEAAEALERRVARAAEAAEDVVESHVVDQIRSGETGRSNTGSPRFLLDLQKVTVDLEYMRRKAMNVKAQNGNEATNAAAAAAAAAFNKAAPATTTMVGFEEVHLQLLDKLTGVPSSRQVIPIVGMGGIGKTFLARNAYKDKLTEGHFDVRLWAAISQQYKVEKILAELVSGIRQFKSKNFAESTGYRIVDQAPDVELHKSLYGRRYLIVLDDMWSIEAWDAIQYLLPNLLNLRLFAYSVIGSEWTTVEGKFPSLKCLEIWGCDELVSLNVESSHFPALQRLHLSDLPNLDELPLEIGEITTLEGIIIEHCSESSSMSAIRILVEQEELGNADFWVRVSLRGDEETLKRFENQVQDEGLRGKNLFLDLQIVKP